MRRRPARAASFAQAAACRSFEQLQHLVDRRAGPVADEVAISARVAISIALPGGSGGGAAGLAEQRLAAARRGIRRCRVPAAPCGLRRALRGAATPGGGGGGCDRVSCRAIAGQQVAHRRLRRGQDIQVLHRLLQAAHRHDVEVRQHRVPLLGVIGLVERDHVAFAGVSTCGLVGIESAARLPSTQLSLATCLVAAGSVGSSTLWKPSTVKKPGMPSVSGLPERADEHAHAGRARASAGRHGGNALRGCRAA